MSDEETITVIEIISDYLRNNGYDGLYNAHDNCGCGKDDLSPCYDNPFQCKPAYKTIGIDGPIYGPRKEQS